ncbi:MAG: hypothetical protein O7F74_10615 [Bacteroidetes bacterium]|nr:hypothetical protein [Bacteroidota bacterium]
MSKINKPIAVLKKQLAKLDNENFDLEAWKSSSTVFLSRLFGDKDTKVKQIQGLKIDYGSWTLRDASSSYNPVISCKKQGREIIEAAINELETFGLPETSSDTSVIMQALEGHLKVSQLKALNKVLAGDKSEEDKNKELIKMISSWDKDAPIHILSEILLASELKDLLE